MARTPKKTVLKPFFGYFGGKYRIAPRYPAPQHELLVEPFAGAAGYALRYPERKVLLVEMDPVVCAVWRYLIHEATEERVLALPLLEGPESKVSGMPGLSDAERFLIQLNLSAGDARPRDSISCFGRDYRPPWAHLSHEGKPTTDTSVGVPHPGYENFWGEKRRARVARQLGAIRHWAIVEGDYSLAPDEPATWFIDPPYEAAGRAYKFHDIDRDRLAQWCLTRRGQVIVCEAEGASWLPFEPLGKFKSRPHGDETRKTSEVIFYKENS